MKFQDNLPENHQDYILSWVVYIRIVLGIRAAVLLAGGIVEVIQWRAL